MKKFESGESGQTLVFLTLTMTVLVGFTGLAVDVGMHFNTQRKLQIAADAAAIAAERTYHYTPTKSTAQTAGAVAAENNYYGSGTSGTAASNGSIATINIPPTSGPITTGSYSEAIVTIPDPTSFMGALGFGNVTVSARAVAGESTYGTSCIYLAATKGTGLYMKGSATITAPNCGIYVNSPDSAALSAQDNGDIVTSTFLDVVGNAQSDNFANGSTPAQFNSAPQSNPYPNVGTPSTCGVSDSSTSITTNYTPAASVVCFTSANPVTIGGGTAITFGGSAGGTVYVFENGVNVAGNVTFGSIGSPGCSGTGASTVCQGAVNGATVDVEDFSGNTKTSKTPGTFTQNNNVLSIYAPTTGTYNGVALLVPPTNLWYAASSTASDSGGTYSCDTSSVNMKNDPNSLNIQWGSSGQTFDGWIVAPLAVVYINDSGNGVTASGLDACALSFNSGNKGLSIPSYDAANKGTTSHVNIVLME